MECVLQFKITGMVQLEKNHAAIHHLCKGRKDEKGDKMREERHDSNTIFHVIFFLYTRHIIYM